MVQEETWKEGTMSGLWDLVMAIGHAVSTIPAYFWVFFTILVVWWLKAEVAHRKKMRFDPESKDALKLKVGTLRFNIQMLRHEIKEKDAIIEQLREGMNG
jgi:hypothetical protein